MGSSSCSRNRSGCFLRLSGLFDPPIRAQTMDDCRVVSLSDEEIAFLHRAVHGLYNEIEAWMPGQKRLLWREENKFKEHGEVALAKLDKLIQKIEFLTSQYGDQTELGLSTKIDLDDEES